MNPWNLNPNWIDQQIGSLLEAWYTRDVDEDQCRFCNRRLDEPAPSEERFCDDKCDAAFEKVFEARLAIGKRDLEQRGYD